MPETPHSILLAAVTILCVLGAITDLRSRKIPNWLTLGALPIGLIASGILGGWMGLFLSFVAVLLALLIYFPLYLLRAMGAGDAKLMAAIASFIGPLMWIHLFIFASILGGVAAVLFTLAKGQFKIMLGKSMDILRSLSYFQAPYAANPELDIRSAKSLSLPHGAVIALAWFVLLFLWTSFDFRIIRF
ncbi:MAG: prepilin peptidase [Bryobacterales bacterium]|nr:prepilin peptidase [Bryobacterales bacterium]